MEEIGTLCGIHGRKTLGPVIERLEQLALIKVERSLLRAPSRFTMLRFEEGIVRSNALPVVPIGNHVVPVGNCAVPIEAAVKVTLKKKENL